MTIDEIKDQLPDIRVRINDTFWLATVRGRLNPVATIHPYCRIDGDFPNASYDGPGIEYPWQAIAASINHNIALHVLSINFGE